MLLQPVSMEPAHMIMHKFKSEGIDKSVQAVQRRALSDT